MMRRTDAQTSTVDLKALYPQATTAPYAELEYCAKDPLCNNRPSVTFWHGKSVDHCEAHYETILRQGRQKQFLIPGIPYVFMVVNGKIYYRKNVE